jgi:hypothetical protein
MYLLNTVCKAKEFLGSTLLNWLPCNQWGNVKINIQFQHMVKAHSSPVEKGVVFNASLKCGNLHFIQISPGSLIINTCLLWESWARRGAGEIS